VIETSLGPLQATDAAELTSKPVPSPCTLAIRPERLRLLPAGAGAGPNRVAATVREVVYRGPETHYLLDANGTILRARVMNNDSGPTAFGVGQAVLVELPPKRSCRWKTEELPWPAPPPGLRCIHPLLCLVSGLP